MGRPAGPAVRAQEGAGVLTAPQLLAARLDLTGPEHTPEPCAICGGLSTHGAPFDDVCGSLTTDAPSFRAPSSQHVCLGCALTRGRKANPIGRASGWYCNFSHFVDDSRIENASKGEKPKILAWLRGPKRGAWFCAVADTGQKHLVCYAPVNPPGARGRVRFEERDVALPDADGWRIVEDMAALLTAGATKEELDRGDYTARAWTLCGDGLRAFEREHGRHRGGAWFALALWLAQRDEEQVQARLSAEKEAKRGKAQRKGRGAAPVAVGGDAAGVPAALPGHERVQAIGVLADAARRVQGRGDEHGEHGRVGDIDPAQPEDRAVGQFSMFDAAGAVLVRPREVSVPRPAEAVPRGVRAARGTRAKDQRGAKGEVGG